MTTYTIQKWNETIDCSNILRPIFTFVPDDPFIEYILTNPNPILISIINCPVYNNGLYYAMCISSADFPSFGPNYYEITKEYVMVLITPFTLFPKNGEYGEFKLITNIRTPDILQTQEDFKKKTNKENFHYDTYDKNEETSDDDKKEETVDTNKEDDFQYPYEQEEIIEVPIDNCGCSSSFSSWLMISLIFIISIIVFIIIYSYV